MNRAVLAAALVGERWDDVLERAARAAATAVDAPIGAVSLLSTRLEHFAAHVGLPAELEVSRAVARDLSFCRVVTDSGAAFVVGDTIMSPALRPELVDAFAFRAYVGVPVEVSGVVVGALCALDRRPRAFGDADIARLVVIAKDVSARLAERAAGFVEHVDAVDVDVVEVRPYLRLLQAVQAGALEPDAMARALRVLPAVPRNTRAR